MNTLSNKEISQLFELSAELMELSGENPFKIKSYSIAAFRIGKLSRPLTEMTDSEIRKIENVGPAMVMKIEEILQTGTMVSLEEMLKETPPGIIEMLQIKGLGAKKVRQLWLELEIESIGELAYACQENRLTSIKGFGKKTQENILSNINYILANKGKFLLAAVHHFAIELLEALLNDFPENKIALVGEFARQNNVINSIDFLSDLEQSQWKQFFQDRYGSSLIAAENHNSVQLESLPIIHLYPSLHNTFGIQQFTHNSAKAFFEAFILDFELPSTAENENEIFSHHKLPFIPAPLREIENYAPLLKDKVAIQSIHINDIKGLIHCHSTWSDGTHSIKEMAKACIAKGWEYMVITDHSIAAFYANGLTEERIIAQHQEIDELNKSLAPFKIYKGIEADILYSGDLDYNERVWPLFDMIIASVHSNLRMTPEKANERILKALDNPYVKILGHPTGRLLLSRNGYAIDHQLIIDKCAEKNIVIEINAHPRRLDLDWSWINYALSKGVKLSINPDAHSVEGINLIEYGILSSQKTLIQNKDNLSSLGKDEFEKAMNL